MRDTSFTGSLKDVEPKRLVDQNNYSEVESFFLVLGLFYNDLKSLTFYLVQLNDRFENLNKKKKEPSNDFGEYQGMRSHLDRLFIGTLHEFLRFLKENEDILKTTTFGAAYKTLNRGLKDRWDSIVEIAKNSDTKNTSHFAKILLIVRNNISFHYYDCAENLRRGFIEYFFLQDKDSINDRAYYSVGEEMRLTRFFFSDAASARFVYSEIEKKKNLVIFFDDLKKVVEDLNLTIKGLMSGYLGKLPHRKN